LNFFIGPAPFITTHLRHGHVGDDQPTRVENG
jgi:hypothetical protein